MTEDRDLRRAVQDTLGAVPSSPVPLEAIVRRGRGIRLRRVGSAVAAVGLAGILAVTSVALHGNPSSAAPPAAPVGAPVAPGGVIAQGTAGGYPWRLAVADIADPGYTCLPAIILNGTDADPVYPDPGTAGVVALGSALPGEGFAFVQVPADVNGIVVNGDTNVPAVTVAACGLRYHVAGFAYSLAEPLDVTVTNPPPDWPPAFTMPVVSIQAPSTHVTPESPGLWTNMSSAQSVADGGSLTAGTLSDGQEWFISLQFGPGGDCYEFDASSSANSDQMGYCGPVSTPGGPETIMALPLGFPKPGTGAIGYALQVSPDTAALVATLSDGSTQQAAFCVVAGRTYAAFVVPDPLKLTKLTWLDTQGGTIASTTDVPLYGYTQFQP